MLLPLTDATAVEDLFCKNSFSHHVLIVTSVVHASYFTFILFENRTTHCGHVLDCGYVFFLLDVPTYLVTIIIDRSIVPCACIIIITKYQVSTNRPRCMLIISRLSVE